MATLEETIAIHKTKPWIKDFRGVLIRPLKPVNKEWLGPRITLVSKSGKTADWFAPTDAFWAVHAKASHPVGADDKHHCSAKIHTAFLTETGSNAEFAYGYQRKSDGVLVVETTADFAAECAWWDSYFAKKAAGGARAGPLGSVCTVQGGGCKCGAGCQCGPACPCRAPKLD
jgi:hypothetical protein